MVRTTYDPLFQKRFSKIKDQILKEKILKQFTKIKNNPEIGKSMKYGRKNTREVYIKPFRLSYLYLPKEDKILFLDLYHKDKQ